VKKRYLYLLLFAIPGFFIAALFAFFILAAVAGVFWIFLFGDNTWPDATQWILPLALFLVFAVAWAIAMVVGYKTGKNLESSGILNRKHILVAIAFTIAPLLFMYLYQLKVGNIGTQPDSILCGNYCMQAGYNASETSPGEADQKACTCLHSGAVILKVPVTAIRSSE